VLSDREEVARDIAVVLLQELTDDSGICTISWENVGLLAAKITNCIWDGLYYNVPPIKYG
jgi:hypothetical protein